MVGEHKIRRPERLRPTLNVVIIGAGSHALAAAYYLARNHGIHKVAVLAQGSLGGPDPAGNVADGCWSYSTPQAMHFHEQNVRRWPTLARELDLPLCRAPRGHFALAHCDGSLRTLRWRCEINRHHGVRCAIVDRDFLKAQLPLLDLECGGEWPIVAALYHQPGALADHDALIWGYGRAVDRLGIEIHQQTEVIGVDLQDQAVVGVRTTRGRISTRRVLCAAAGETSRVVELAGLRIPLRVQPVQAMVSEPMKQWLDPVVRSDALGICVSQTSRGELVLRADPDPYELHQARPTLEYAEILAARLLELFPTLGAVKVLSQWAGLVEMTPDQAPIMGSTPIVGFYLDAGWGTSGFAATPISGLTLGHSIACGHDHPLIECFSLSRFAPGGEHRDVALAG